MIRYAASARKDMKTIDTALLLRIRIESGEQPSDKEISDLLQQSRVVKKLIVDYEENPFFNLFRLICLSEIPYAECLPYTQKVMAYISDYMALSEGFSYTGEINDIVPCYNAMLLEAYTRLGKVASPEVQAALEWIKQYQVFSRNQSTKWKHNGIFKHGGCMNATPCYIGVGKTVRALITYNEFTNYADKEVETLIKKGTCYMLQHNMYQRLSNHAPISNHITNIMFPQAYMLTLTDLVYIAGKRQLWADTHTDYLKKMLERKACDKESWKIDYIYNNKGYKAFDSPLNSSDWIDYLFCSSLKNT